MRLICALLLLMGAAMACADTTRIQQIPLQNRSAEELIPLIKPLLGQDGGISGQGYTLIIRASDDQIEEIEKVVRELDKAARRFIISVEQVRDDTRARQETGADGRVVIDNGSAGGDVTIHGTKTGDRSGGSTRQQVMATENQPAFIQLGQRIPEGTRLRFAPGLGVLFEESSGWIDLATGFSVIPRLLPDETVQLTIRVQGETPDTHSPPTIQTNNMETSVRIPLNQWVTLGASDEAFTSSDSAIVHRTQARGSEALILRIHAALR